MRAEALLLAALVAAGAGRAGAQAPGECELGRAEGEIDVGGVYAKVFNTGSLFFGNTSQAAYEVPKGSGKSPIFAAGLWVGGLVEGELRVAGATYADFEFWPGPLDPATGRPPNPNDCSDYDRIWRVSRHDVAEYYRTGVAARDLAEWPFDLGAPVLDGDGDSTNYNLAGGDQPAISGDQILWWVMNDVGNHHRNSLVPPIGIEVQTSVFGFGGGPRALNQATFYRYRLVNRGPVALDSAYVAVFADPDLGDAGDDYSGSDTLRQMGFVFNADDADGNGSGSTYGAPAPAFGIQVVEGPVALPNTRDDDGDGETDESGERAGLTAFLNFLGGAAFPALDPANGEQMYQVMRGRWVDGTPVTQGGYGLNPGSTDTTTTMYSGDPVPPHFWSERCPGGFPPSCGSPAQPGDRRFYLSTGPFRLAPAGSEEVLVSMVFGQGGDHLDSITELRRASHYAQNAHDAGLLDPHRVPGFVQPVLPAAIELRRPAPNPFDDAATIGITLPAAADVRVALFDVLGRAVLTAQDGPLEAGAHEVTIDAAGLAPGAYLARVWVAGQDAGAFPLTRR
jgi:hypothetical protein